MLQSDRQRRSRATHRRWQVSIALAIALCGSTGFAQDVTEPSLKAAFIYSFAKFTEWPGDVLSTTTPFVACVLGDDQTGDALDRAVRGRLLAGRTVKVSKVAATGPLRSCHLLYVSGIAAAQTAQVMTSLRNVPVLTISDIDDFEMLGGIARMFVESGKMRFDLNYGLAKRSRLQFSSKLLSLASQVRDEPAGVGR
jgi:hypothetical protein